MTAAESTKPKTTFNIELKRYGSPIEKVAVTVRKLPRIIAWNGDFFQQVGETYYEEVSGEDLSNIRTVNNNSILHGQQQAST